MKWVSFYLKGDENLEGIIDNLENALNTWSAQLAEIWSLLTQDPQNFRGGNIWKIIVQIHGSLKAIGLALLVLFFLYGIVKETTSLKDIKRPEMGLKLFLRFVIARALVVYGMEFMTSLFRISQGTARNAYVFSQLALAIYCLMYCLKTGELPWTWLIFLSLPILQKRKVR